MHGQSSLLCFSVSCTRLTLMSVFFLRLWRSNALQVIGGNKTVVQGGTVILPCKLIDSTELLTQISWQRKTRNKPQTDNFFTILSSNGPQFVNGHDYRFQFVGNFNEENGSLQLSNVTLLDEGVYTCIFTLFPSGNHKTEIPLNLLVPPVTHVKDDLPILGDEEVSLATCTAAGSRPPAEVRWLIGTLAGKVRATTNSTEHANGTTTTVSSLVGVPTREIHHHVVHCVVTNPALSKEETVTFTIQVQFSPKDVNISVRSTDSFQCLTQANPKATFTWNRHGNSWPQSAVRVEGATLQFLSMSSDLNGLYQCEASNQYGRDHGYLYVHVTSGTCTTCWAILGLLLSLIVGLAVAATAWKFFIHPRTVQVIREEVLKARRKREEKNELQEAAVALKEEMDGEAAR
ncbi:nectin-3-like protein isoform X1 [Toxotes jaculatrix]|uniref:nectin-3-like protein isoform X1 n=1 Tax=Toxotes jaculatrix TaxID=941984 RepID=UPI001B3B0E94|nr:nectin-3-like protein isoform X1 [Toxotes jaculatrix]XP_040913195.1 nectin-3-like protein isoform X1 [Toxotes jaculatrix]